VISAGAQSAIEELNEIVRLDGGELRVKEASPTAIHLELDLTQSSCPECVVPRDLMMDILQANMTKADPDICHIELDDPREQGN
jgi:hypothetical protein